jgi:hypothetical protein
LNQYINSDYSVVRRGRSAHPSAQAAPVGISISAAETGCRIVLASPQ